MAVAGIPYGGYSPATGYGGMQNLFMMMQLMQLMQMLSGGYGRGGGCCCGGGGPNGPPGGGYGDALGGYLGMPGYGGPGGAPYGMPWSSPFVPPYGGPGGYYGGPGGSHGGPGGYYGGPGGSYGGPGGYYGGPGGSYGGPGGYDRYGNYPPDPSAQIPNYGQNAGRGQVDQMLEAAAAKYGIPPNILKAVAWQESGWRANASSFDGGHGKGVMQIDDRFHQFARTQAVWNPSQNIEYGARYLRQLYDKTGSWQEALRRYNGGSSYPPKIFAHAQNQPWNRGRTVMA